MARNRIPFTGSEVPVGFRIGRRGQLKRDRRFKRNLPWTGPIPVGYRLGRRGQLKVDRRAARNGMIGGMGMGMGMGMGTTGMGMGMGYGIRRRHIFGGIVFRLAGIALAAV